MSVTDVDLEIDLKHVGI